MAFPAVAPRALLFVWVFHGLLFANAARDEDRSEVSSLVMVSSGHMIASSRKALAKGPEAAAAKAAKEATDKALKDSAAAGTHNDAIEETTADRSQAVGGEAAAAESKAAHQVNQMVPVWTAAGATWAKSGPVDAKVKAAVEAKVQGLPDPAKWAPQEGEFVNARDRAAIAVFLKDPVDGEPAKWEAVEAEATGTKEGDEPIIEQKEADAAKVSFSDIDELGRPAGAYGTPEWYAHQTPLAIEMAANQAVNRIAAKNNNLHKLTAQYTDMKNKWQDSADKVWKGGKNVGEKQDKGTAGGENFIQATGHYWMDEAQTFRTAAADMRKHTDEVYADIVKSHEVAGHQQLRSFKEEIAKLDPVFKRHQAIYDVVHPAEKAHAEAAPEGEPAHAEAAPEGEPAHAEAAPEGEPAHAEAAPEHDPAAPQV